MILFVILTSLFGYVLLGFLLAKTNARRIASISTQHRSQGELIGNIRFGSTWDECSTSVCMHPEWKHRIDRSLFRDWVTITVFLWPVVFPLIYIRTMSNTLMDKYDPAVIEALEVRIKNLENQNDITKKLGR